MVESVLEARLLRLAEVLRSYGSTIVAFSGGVDSAVVAKAAKDALGEWAIAATSDSPTLARTELDQAFATAESIGIRMYAVERSELDDPRFAENPFNRCFFCKEGLQTDLQELAKEIKSATVSYGVNMDDLHEWRPGIEAAKQGGARFPLVEAEMTKADVRAAARLWGLGVAEKPASPCLASRIPYGERVTEEKLLLVERAEDFVKGLGFSDCRVRHIDGVARVEVPEREVVRLFEVEPFIEENLRAFGFREVKLDSRGLKSGRLNEEYREVAVNGG